MTTTSKLFTRNEYPKDDVDEDGEPAEHETQHEKHAPDPAFYAREPRHAAADPGDPAVRDRAAQPVDRKPGPRSRRCGEQARFRLVVFRLCERALREQLVQLLEL